tara:strand:- start:4796 stop:5959 length:1164 start_codon:yes stop_codon:yes gene_type:complete
MDESFSDNKLIVFAGGGTGGHLLPGIAVAEQLVSLDSCRITFVGSNRPVEQQIIENAGYQHLRLPSLSTSDFKRAPFRFLWNNSRAFFQARHFLRTEKPAVVIGLGGFASVPVVVAASWLKIPIVLLEQNIIPGRANRFLFPRADRVCTSFAVTLFQNTASDKTSHPKMIFTGNPIRTEILQEVSLNAEKRAESDESLILVLGGSQGATAVNTAVVTMLEKSGGETPGKLHLVHQTGITGFAEVENAYERLKERYPELKVKVTVQPFFTDLTKWYPRADLVISRAGATTLAELACVGCPTILIPFPNSIGDHQLINARFYEDQGAAILIEQAQEPDSTAQSLREAVLALLKDNNRRSQMAQAMRKLSIPQAARQVSEEVSKLISSQD